MLMIDCGSFGSYLAITTWSGIFGPIPWGYSGPLCHMLSLSLLSWTYHISGMAEARALKFST